MGAGTLRRLCSIIGHWLDTAVLLPFRDLHPETEWILQRSKTGLTFCLFISLCAGTVVCKWVFSHMKQCSNSWRSIKTVCLKVWYYQGQQKAVKDPVCLFMFHYTGVLIFPYQTDHVLFFLVGSFYITRNQQVALLFPGTLSLTCQFKQAYACSVSSSLWLARCSQEYTGQPSRITEMTVSLLTVW